VVKNLIYVSDGAAGMTILRFDDRKKAQSITFDALPTLAVDEPPFAIQAHSSSGLPVEFSVPSGPGIIENGLFRTTGFGVGWIRAEQKGDAEFRPESSYAYFQKIPADPWEAWFAINYPEVPSGKRGAKDDADGDGASNEVEKAFGTDPTIGSPTHGRLSVLSAQRDPWEGVRSVMVRLGVNAASYFPSIYFPRYPRKPARFACNSVRPKAPTTGRTSVRLRGLRSGVALAGAIVLTMNLASTGSSSNRRSRRRPPRRGHSHWVPLLIAEPWQHSTDLKR